MLFVDFARWVLLAFGLLVSVVLAFLIGQFGWLGDGIRDGLIESTTDLQKFYQRHKAIIDGAAAVILGGGGAVSGALAIHRSWYYAERNLPERLLALVRRNIAKHIDGRPALLAAINDPISPTRFFAPVVYSGYFDWLLTRRGLGQARNVAGKLHASLDTLRGEIEVVVARKEELQTQVVTAHLLRGAYIAGQAALEPQNSPERRAENEKALEEFLAAVKINGNDADALELAAKQHLILGDDEPALTLLQRMANVAAGKEDILRHARALRMRAEVLSKSIRTADWDNARAILTMTTNEVLAGLTRSSPEKTLELARAYRFLGEVQMTREKFTAARTALNRAMPLFQGLASPFGREGVASTKDALQRLEELQKDREAPGAE